MICLKVKNKYVSIQLVFKCIEGTENRVSTRKEQVFNIYAKKWTSKFELVNFIGFST